MVTALDALSKRITAWRMPPPSSVEQAIRFVSPKTSGEEIVRLQEELRENRSFLQALADRTDRVLSQQTAWDERTQRLTQMRDCFLAGEYAMTRCGQELLEFLYLVVRLRKPAVMIETGTFYGVMGSVVLQAMAENGTGRFITVDKPAYEPIPSSTDLALPEGTEPGWLIPDSLRHHLTLLTGDSRSVLPQALDQERAIDIFMHDSLHTYEHMWFEYQWAWSRLKDGGILLSDDIGWNLAFHRFCRSKQRPYVHLGTFGAALK